MTVFASSNFLFVGVIAVGRKGRLEYFFLEDEGEFKFKIKFEAGVFQLVVGEDGCGGEEGGQGEKEEGRGGVKEQEEEEVVFNKKEGLG